MRKEIVYLIICFCGFLFSCSSPKSNPAILAQIDSSIIQANCRLITSNNDIIESLKLKTTDVRTQDKAERWLPIAMKADSVTRNVLHYIDGLKTALKERLPSKGVNDFFEEDGRGHTLFQKLLHFKTKVVAIDSASDDRNWPMFFHSSKDSTSNAKAFLLQFQSSSLDEVQTFLSALQSDILRSAQQYLSYCHAVTASTRDHFEVFEAIVGQNAQVLQVGNTLEITAGLGRFSNYKIPEISIAGKVMPMNERGFVVHKMKTPKRLGRYSIPVKFQFVDEDGKSQEREFNVAYRIVDTIARH